MKKLPHADRAATEVPGLRTVVERMRPSARITFNELAKRFYVLVEEAKVRRTG
jgi:hypothetical protein